MAKSYKRKEVKEAIELLIENPIIIDRIRVVLGDPKMSDKKVKKNFKKILYMVSSIGGENVCISADGDEAFISGARVKESKRHRRIEANDLYDSI